MKTNLIIRGVKQLPKSTFSDIELLYPRNHLRQWTINCYLKRKYPSMGY